MSVGLSTSKNSVGFHLKFVDSVIKSEYCYWATSLYWVGFCDKISLEIEHMLLMKAAKLWGFLRIHDGFSFKVCSIEMFCLQSVTCSNSENLSFFSKFVLNSKFHLISISLYEWYHNKFDLENSNFHGKIFLKVFIQNCNFSSKSTTSLYTWPSTMADCDSLCSYPDHPHFWLALRSSTHEQWLYIKA